MKLPKLESGYDIVVANMGAQTDECILWPGVIATSGYAQFQYNHVRYSAHRFMCVLVHGEPPSDKHHASHSCGVRHCINPRHVSWKTPAGNMADKHVHGTYRPTFIGIKKAREIRLLQGKERADQAAARFGITESNVRRIWDGEIWKEELWRDSRVFTPEEVLEIQALRPLIKRGTDITTGKIAQRYGARPGQIRRIMKQAAPRRASP